MTRHDEARLKHRQRLLAAVLLTAAGLFDGLAGSSDLDDDPYVVGDPGALLRLDMTGWVWAHLVLAVLMLVAGLLLFTTRPWPVRLAAVIAGASILVHVIMLPFETVWAAIVIGLAVAVLRLLWVCRRQGPRADDVSPDRPFR
ncbi:hypothetical protein ACNAW0_19785 [Micromonospora sp. SL1-18]|uniref:DUF7144 family membrane protein n=1 Tax=Micromonospora sp. SL1-18 TaxID=3399128 RepID=UPI003A4E2CD4